MLALGTPWSARAQDAEHGALLAEVARCASCHTAKGGAPYAGGYPLETAKGTFYGPNITPDPRYGIGAWQEKDLRRALRKGTSPKGSPYYPAFPYTSFTKLTDADIADLWAYLQTLAPVPEPSRHHKVHGIAGWRGMLRLWKVTGLKRRPDKPTGDPLWDRGRYLVDAVAHCQECHSGRGNLGGLKAKRYLAGNDQPPERGPNITPHAHGTEQWAISDWVSLLEDGMTTEGDFVGGEMRRVVRQGTSKLPLEDLEAMAGYLVSVKAEASKPPPEPRPQERGEEEWW